MPAPALLDLAHLSRQTFDDRALERDVLALFDQQCLRLLPVIAREEIGRGEALHTLKGAALAVGAWRVASLAGDLETALAWARAPDAVRRALGELEAAIGETRAALAKRLVAAI